MAPDELLSMAVANINRHLRGESPIIAGVYLVVPRDAAPTGKTIRLAGREGPRGEICTVKASDKMPGVHFVTAIFPALEVARYILGKAEGNDLS